MGLIVVEVLFLLIIGVLLVTQIVIPFKRGTSIFPDFGGSKVRVKTNEVEHVLEEVTEAEELKRSTNELNRRTAKLKGKQ